MNDMKPTNPKDAIGSTKVPYDLVPESAIAELATGFLEGALKYGRYNWRAKGVRASIYYSAMRRHMAKWYNGEDADEKTRVKHLASVMACCAIILDADLCGKLNDDRPPKAPVSKRIDELFEVIAHLKGLFKDEHPHQYTIADSEEFGPDCPGGCGATGLDRCDDCGFTPEVPIVFEIKDAERSKEFDELVAKLMNDHREALGIHPRAVKGEA